ncbi:MAG: hypothetical protein K0M78_05170 [Brevundimonas sp.]|nr:hypothetical protein [Brevundimonas sp.]
MLATLLIGSIVALVLGERSVIFIQNRGDTRVGLTVETTNPSSFSWSGSLRPGERVFRTSRFSDNSFLTVCRDETGTHRSGGGYVTNGMPQRIDIVVDGCETVSVDVETMP